MRCKWDVTLIMRTLSVTIHFSANDGAQFLTSCLEQPPIHLN